jgi:hypothetical protein
VKNLSIAQFQNLVPKQNEIVVIRDDRKYDATHTLRGGVVAVFTPNRPKHKVLQREGISMIRNYLTKYTSRMTPDSCIEVTHKGSVVGYLLVPDDDFNASQVETFNNFRRQQALHAYVAVS